MTHLVFSHLCLEPTVGTGQWVISTSPRFPPLECDALVQREENASSWVELLNATLPSDGLYRQLFPETSVFVGFCTFCQLCSLGQGAH